MKIAIEGQRLFRRNKHGMDMVALELIRNLQKIDTQNEYYIFVKPGPDSNCLQPTANFQIIPLTGHSYPLWEQVSLPVAVKKAGCDLLHCTSNTAPVFSSIPLLVTVHDIIYLENLSFVWKSGTWYQKFGNIYRRLVVRRLIRKCRKIITVSEFEKKRIAEFFGLPNDDRLVAVYNGVSQHFRKIEDNNLLNEMRRKYRLPARYIFFLGNTDPKKNTPNTLKAYAIYRRKSQSDIPLVMLDFDRSRLEKLLDSIQEPDLINHIHLTGYVPNIELPSVYTLCELFLYPSLRESFGIPILEAMACGVPVITSNTSSMPEVSGNAALLINPGNPDEIADAIINLQQNSELRTKLINSGYIRAQQFSWENMARKVLSEYYKVYENRH